MKLHSTLTLPALLHCSENWTITARDARRITAAEMKCMRTTAGYTWTYLKKKHGDSKGTKYNPSFGQSTGIQKESVASCKQNTL